MKLRRFKNKLVTIINNKVNSLKRPPKVMLIDETINYIIENKCSVLSINTQESLKSFLRSK